MTSISNIEEFLRYIHAELDTDILFECFVALFQEEGEAMIDLDVVPHDHHRRNYSNDLVPSARLYPGEPVHYLRASGPDKATLFTSRSSILDYLSEDFVIEPDNKDQHATTGRESEQHLEKSRDRKNAQIQAAHKFFQPLEVTCNRMRILREIREVKSLKNLDKFLIELWGIKYNTPSWYRFACTLHLIPNIIGDLEATKALCEYVLQCEVQLNLKTDAYTTLSPAQKESILGNTPILGHSTRCGDRVFDYQEACDFVLHDLAQSDFINYLDERSAERKLLDELINHYFPLNVEVNLDFKVRYTDESHREQLPILGYSSKLGA